MTAARAGRCGAADEGSTFPLILGFFLLAMVVVAGAVAAGDAFVQQRGLQDTCDGAALAAAGAAVDLNRGPGVAATDAAQFAGVSEVVDAYLARDPARRSIRVRVELTDDRRILRLTCEATEKVTFGTLFGKGDGVHHVVHSDARSPLN